ncbi:pyridoxal-phosphate dependent enzyme [Ornithinimicrobium sp. F0845]|uniref:pyridoxal-phosphate dependent enzyme n=1 Tax=Ornithinimicrobium sp. F0845 TaxID=2926412 RepID=UPI00248A9EE1|nr:pyridoxal-phosphate dependent enzyme [Ornithinimicrobium sp. F0845]
MTSDNLAAPSTPAPLSTSEALGVALDRLPRHRVGFYPTPFHALPNLSRELGINLFMKREDLAGPSAVSGSKTRLAEFILGRALEQGAPHLITKGAYLTNSGLQFAAACLSAGSPRSLFSPATCPGTAGWVRHAETTCSTRRWVWRPASST